MGLFGFFGKSFDPSSYEREFSSISTSIKKSDSRISKLKKLQTKVKHYLISIAVAIYAAISAVNYSKLPSSDTGRNFLHKYVGSQSLDSLLFLFVLYPLGSVGLVKLILAGFSLLVRKNEAYLKKLKTKQTLKIEELKKLTNFNSTNEILNKYDDNLKAKAEKERQLKKQQLQQKPQQGTQGPSIPHQQALAVNEKLRKELSMSGSVKSGVGEKLLDWVIGSENNESIENRYALICRNCYTHNGLAPPSCEDPENVRFACWHCTFLNGPATKEGVSEEEAAAASVPADIAKEVGDANEDGDIKNDEKELVKTDDSEKKEDVSDVKRESQEAPEVSPEAPKPKTAVGPIRRLDRSSFLFHS